MFPCFFLYFSRVFFRWFYISFSDKQISFILWVWIVWALYYCGEFCFLFIAYTIILFVHTYIHTCTDDIMMRTKCEIRNCGNASDRIWLINAGKCAKILEISCISMIIGWMQWIELILYIFIIRLVLSRIIPFVAALWKKVNGFQTLINYVVKVESRKNGANFIEIKIILDLL